MTLDDSRFAVLDTQAAKPPRRGYALTSCAARSRLRDAATVSWITLRGEVIVVTAAPGLDEPMANGPGFRFQDAGRCSKATAR
ncbi:hypothetical protein [Bradyrhizobium acaciae]|uniref:hypothetical protein n=1 Tax=Bradyrhizobium acaciae TaxID=2683706 RepID=UPI001E473E86|nr:hypothetical protein [Bradyrhizobium acaciae]MCC8977865.1 hypothetical protein [Bradyrhizobium acaciae]